MNCKDCAYWFEHRTFSGEDKHGKRHLLRTHGVGTCERFQDIMPEISGKFDEITCPMSSRGGHGEGEVGGAVVTGRDFGCIKFEQKKQPQVGV